MTPEDLTPRPKVEGGTTPTIDPEPFQCGSSRYADEIKMNNSDRGTTKGTRSNDNLNENGEGCMTTEVKAKQKIRRGRKEVDTSFRYQLIDQMITEQVRSMDDNEVIEYINAKPGLVADKFRHITKKF